MIMNWIQTNLPGRPELANEPALLNSNPDLFWQWVICVEIVLLTALLFKQMVDFWCLASVALVATVVFASGRNAAIWYTPLGDLLLIQAGVATIVYTLYISKKQHELTGASGLGGMWLFALLIVGAAAFLLLTK